MKYRFLPHAQRALAAGLTIKDNATSMPGRGSLPVVLAVNETDIQPVNIATHGPGDVRGLDTRAITRLEPVRGTQNHPPNQMAAIEFGPPDLPWLFTPARPDDDNHLTPWLALIVVEQQPGVVIDVRAGLPLPVLSIKSPASPFKELPSLDEAWAWAHAQIVKTPEDQRSDAEILGGDPSHRLSRIVAPRRLAPDKSYYACLVPTFDQGRRAGFGETVDSSENLKPAWSTNATEVHIPLYFHWSFSTGERGDFESLAREMKPRDPPRQAGGRPTFVGAMHPAIALNAQDDGAVVALPGALRTPGSKNPVLADIAKEITGVLPKLLDAPRDQENQGAIQTSEPLSPPLYGRWHIGQHAVPKGAPHWFRSLNLDPRHRITAGLGAEVVRRRQEEFMQAAWEQVGEILRVNRQLDLTRFGGILLTRLHEKHILPLPSSDLIKLSAPIHALVGKGRSSVLKTIDRSSLPTSLAGENGRRFTSPQHVTRKTAARTTALKVAKLNKASKTLALAAAPGFEAEPLGLAFDAIAGTKFHLGLDLTKAVVGLSALGLKTSLDRPDVTRLRNLGNALERTDVKALELRSDIGTTGIFDDNHIKRLRSVVGDKSLNATVATFVESARNHRGTVGFRLDPGAHKLMFRPLDLADGNRIEERPTGRNSGIAKPLPLAQLNFSAMSNSLVANELERQPAGRFNSGPRRSRMPAINTRPVGSTPTVRPDASTVIRPLVLDSTTMSRLRSATNAHRKDVGDRLIAPPPKPPVLQLPDMGNLIAEATKPADVVRRRNLARVRAFGELFESGPVERGDEFIIIEETDRILFGPRIPRPLYRDLAELAPDRFLPGINDIEANSIILLETSPTFVESFLVGSNSEMMREAIWRGFPTDRRSTVFNQFWDRGPNMQDIPDIHTWSAGAALGKNATSDQAELVLLLRGDLIKRYPGAVVYAVPATEDRKLVPGLVGEKKPIFLGKLDEATLFCGFDLTKEKALADHGWFFVLEQQVTEPNFGFDVPVAGEAMVPGSWQNASWAHTGVGANDPLKVSGGPLASVVKNAAQFAGVTFQRPFRAAIHADKLIKEGGGAD